MSTVLTFDVRFRGPFLVGTGRARPGMDAFADPVVPVPSSSLKGLMRAEASHRLGLPDDVVGTVFGTPSAPSPWAWSDLTFTSERKPQRAARIRVDSDGRVEPGMLVIVEAQWAAEASFEIEQIGAVDDEEAAKTVLSAAAQSISALGSNRRRGLGWASIHRRDHEWTSAETTRIIRLRGGA